MIISNRTYILLPLFFLAFFVSHLPLNAFNEPPTQLPDTNAVFVIGPDDPIVAMLDSLAALKVFQNIERQIDTTLARKFDFPAKFVPVYDDSVYRARISRLNDNSPFSFVYNSQVKAFIDLYAMRQRGLSERVLGLGQLYFPYFEEQLDRFNLPLELKYLAVIESALNPTARSRAGASGMWQFMYHTGRMYGLNVNSYVDDRCDVTRSTIAACEHFIDLYKIYGDWSLVIAAYNSGPGNVNRAIRRAGGAKDFWAISSYLPRETRNYVPAFIAITYVMEHAEDHNLYALPPVYSHLDVDTIQVRHQLGLVTVSELLGIPMDHLRYLNPAFRKSVIPNNPDNPYVLTLPRENIPLFVSNEEAIYNYRSAEQIRQEVLVSKAEETSIHIVRSGENLGSIARQYRTSVAEIQRLNNIRGTMIRVGQRLIVRGAVHVAVPVPSSSNVHVVRKGETLGLIAQRYRISVSNLRSWNKISGTTIHVGQRLVVRPPADS